MAKAPEFRHGICLRIAYQGTGYHGWQAQPDLRTVQGEVENAIDAMGVGHGRVRGCSRTDAGVHARDQVISFASDKEIAPRGWLLGLNQHLPDDIAIRDARACFYRYDPRFHTEHKRYRYLVYCGAVRNPRLCNAAWHLNPSKTRHARPINSFVATDYLDIEAMKEAADVLLGTHDFKAFAASGDERETTERTMFEIKVQSLWQGDESVLAIDVVGNAFLKNMVRIMAGTLVDIGTGHMPVETMSTLIQSDADRTQAGQTAPAQGLTLVKVKLKRFDGPADSFGRATESAPWCISGES